MQDIRTQLSGKRIDWHHLLWPLCAGTSRTEAWFRIEYLDTGMIHLPMVTEPFRLAAQGQALPIPKAANSAGLIEPDGLDAFPLLVRNDHADDPPAIRELLAIEFDNFAVDGLHV